ncbi:MAG: tetratricopeptide repeat protein [Candidatus Omnitrophota bacterium]|nr:tetratricopeptide repeat protein [Candidatus Omnitrophota bacterium]
MKNPPQRLAPVVLQLSLVVILAFAAYVNSIGGKFVWDDYGLVKENVYIRSWGNLPNIFREGFGSGGPASSNFYRPLQAVLHAIDYSIFGLNPAGYHLTSIILHILVSLAIYWFVYLLFSSEGISLLTSLLFVLHPVHTEAVSYISGVSDLLSLLFILLTLIFYIKSYYGNNARLYILALLFFVLALFSKENALILPALILIFHYVFGNKPSTKRLFFLLLVLTGYILFRIIVVDNCIPSGFSVGSFFRRIPGFLAAIAVYLRLLVLPFCLHLDYGGNAFSFGDPQVILGALSLSLLLIFAFLKRRTSPLAAFSIFWFLAMLVPVSNLYPINNFFMMEHWLYAPSLGFFLLSAGLLCKAAANKDNALSLKIFLVSTLTIFFILTFRQNIYWRDSVTLYKRAISFNPNSWVFYNQLGLEYQDLGRHDQAAGCYKKSIQINPQMKGAYNNLANLYKITGRNFEAAGVYKKIIEIDPSDYSAYYNLAALSYKGAKKEDAAAFYSRANDIVTRLAAQYCVQADEYRKEGKNGKAVILYKKALQLYPNNLALLNELSSTYVIMGKSKEAIPMLKKALEFDLDSNITHNNLAVAYYYGGQYELAVKHIELALKLGYEVSPRFLEMIKKYRKRE